MLVPDPAGPGGERVKLLDFGIAKLGAAHLQGEDVKTRTGQIMGTAAYMSPEQFGGHKPTDGQSDVYSLACLMFRLLSGQQPFVSDSGEMAVAAMHMFKPAPPLQTLVPEAAPWLVSLIDSMLRKEPDERPTMAEVAALLQEALPDYAVSRKSLPPFRLEVSGATRLRDLELGTPDRGTPDRGRPSKPPPSELIAPTIDQPGASGVSSPSGSITGATGQAGPPVARRMRRGAVLLVTGLSLISAAGVGGLLACTADILRLAHIEEKLCKLAQTGQDEFAHDTLPAGRRGGLDGAFARRLKSMRPISVAARVLMPSVADRLIRWPFCRLWIARPARPAPTHSPISALMKCSRSFAPTLRAKPV